MKNKRRQYLEIYFVLIFWLVIGLLIGIQSYLQWRQKGYECSFISTVGEQIVSILPWALYTLFILWLVRKLPFHRAKIPYPLLLVYLPIGLLIILFHCTMTALFWWLVSGIKNHEPLSDYFGYIFFGRIILHLMIYAAVVIGCFAYTYYLRFRQEREQVVLLEKLLAESRLDALKTQLQPHFLFNTLNTISMLIRKKDEQSATDVVARLADLLRYVLENREVHWVELRKEMRFIENYLSVEKVRFQHRLHYSIHLDPEAADVLIPDLILQPVVENAVKHGISPKPEGGEIVLSVRKETDAVEILIYDSGSGYSLQSRERNHHALGLRNIEERLEKLYGDKVVFSIAGNEKSGTTVLFKLPIIPTNGRS